MSRSTELLLVLGFFLAAVLLFVFDLGNLPLRDWDEGIVAQVAWDIAQAPVASLRWLYPRLGDTAYVNKPALVHSLIALAYHLGGVNEWMARLPGALLTALSVPLLYGIGREIFPNRAPAVFAALIYLTWLPVVRHGRLAMLDGAVLCFFCFLIWCMLRSRRNLRWALGIGLGFGLICLTKGILGFLLVAIALLFLLWDTPRLLTSSYLWIGIVLGIFPVIGWYWAQRLQATVANDVNLVGQSLRRIWDPVEQNSGPPWYYLLELLKYAWPWLLFVPQGLWLSWKNRNSGWAKLILVWSGLYFLAISLMGTKLPWYILPLYPALALAAGTQCALAWEQLRHRPYPRIWIVWLALLALGGWAGSLYFFFGPDKEPDLQLTLAAAGLTMTVAATLVARQNRQFLAILVWGTYITLLLFVSSNHWVWELAESYAVKPVAAMLQEHTPNGTKIYTTHADTRPSLDFYSQRQIIDVNESDVLQCLWQHAPEPYLLTEQSEPKKLDLDAAQIIDCVDPESDSATALHCLNVPPERTYWWLIKRTKKADNSRDPATCFNKGKKEKEPDRELPDPDVTPKRRDPNLPLI